MNRAKTTKGYLEVHYWLRTKFGKASICESRSCSKRSKKFDWCLKSGKEYQKIRSNYLQLCRSCHTKYDMTDERRERTGDSKRGIPRPDVSKYMKGNQLNRKYFQIKCLFCKKDFWPRNYSRKYCSRKCASDSRKKD